MGEYRHGKSTGYEYDASNDAYSPAPAYGNRFDAIEVRLAAINSLLGAVMAHLLDDQERCSREFHQLWRDIDDDWGTSFRSSRWSFDHVTRKIVRSPTRDAAAAAKAATK